MNTISGLLFILALAGTGAAMAADVAPQTAPAGCERSGGVGADDQDAMLAARREYNLLLTFATRVTGEYQADVAVTLLDRTGAPVASFVSPGPLCYLNLAPGRYRIVATAAGRELSQTATVRRRGARDLYFYWDPL